MAKFQTSESVEINCPAGTVFQYVTDISQATLWRPNISVRAYSDDPFAVGATWNDITKFMGRDMTVNVEVAALEVGQHIEMKQEGEDILRKRDLEFQP
jgi:uncharacterized protein YndB with AHSA1/START domain